MARVFRLSTEFDLAELDAFEAGAREAQTSDVWEAVQAIRLSVRPNGGSCSAEAVTEIVRRFDAPIAKAESLVASPRRSEIGTKAEALIESAIARVSHFHERQREIFHQGLEPLPSGGWRWTEEATPGAAGREGQIVRPLDRVGIYVPGGRASYPSSVIMNVVPALAAGVQEVVVASPPGPSGELPAEVEFVCQRLGVKSVVKAGGAAAVFALAYGIEGRLASVDLIAGPGNRYVNEAKRMVWGSVGVDGLAGPSEVGVMIEEASDMTLAVSDLIAQLEHAPDNRGRVYAASQAAWDRFESELLAQIAQEPRGDIVTASWRDHGCVVIAEDLARLCRAVDAFAPEHLAIHLEDADEAASRIRQAGSISIGPHSAQSFGDYAAGPSHTLPTSGAARFAGPVNVLTFLKISSYTNIDPASAQALAPIAEGFGEMEGFAGHARCARLRRTGIEPDRG